MRNRCNNRKITDELRDVGATKDERGEKGCAKEVVIVSLLSRVICILLTSITAYINPVYDLSQNTTSFSTSRVGDVLGSFTAWDSNHYIAIAQKGYVYEQQFAFHFMYPMLTRALGELISRILSTTLNVKLFVISGILISNVSAILCSVVIYKFTKKLGYSNSTALKASILFSIQPASNFFSVMYPESLFALLSLLGMLSLLSRKFFKASLYFFLSCATKPNAIIYFGFFIWYLLLMPRRSSLSSLALNVLRTIFLSLIVISPFIAIQTYAYFNSCTSTIYNKPTWCSSAVPSVFFYVQSTFWNNGFLRSWSLSNFTNILVFLPLLLVSLVSLLEYLFSNFFNVFTLFTLRLPPPSSHKLTPAISPNLFNYPFVIFWAFLLLVVCFYMQIQTGIRSFISCPMLHIYLARLHDQRSRSAVKSRFFELFLYYCITYSLVASALLGYGYPPI